MEKHERLTMLVGFPMLAVVWGGSALWDHLHTAAKAQPVEPRRTIAASTPKVAAKSTEVVVTNKIQCAAQVGLLGHDMCMAGLNGYRALELAHNGEPVPDRLTDDAEYYHQRFVEEAQGLDAKCQRYKGAWLENRFLAVDIKLKDTAPHTTVADDRERASKECDASFDAAWERVPESGSSE